MRLDLVALAFGIVISLFLSYILSYFFQVPHPVPLSLAPANAPDINGTALLRVIRSPKNIRNAVVAKCVPLVSYKRAAPEVLPHKWALLHFVWGVFTMVVVEVIRPQAWCGFGTGKGPRHLWQGMLSQFPPDVLWKPLPALPSTIARQVKQFMAGTCLVAVLLVIFRGLLSGDWATAWHHMDLAITTLTAITVTIVIRIYASVSCTNQWVSANDSAWVARITGGAYVGYEGTVFHTGDATEGWLLLAGKSARTAMAKLVKKQQRLLLPEKVSYLHRSRDG